MIYKTKYALGNKVYLCTDEMQKERLITQIKLAPVTNEKYIAMYFIVFSDNGDWFYELEFSTEKDISKTL